MPNASEFSITGPRDGSAPSKIVQPSTTSSPIYIKIHANNQPTEAIVDTGSAISIIHLNFLKTIDHNKFINKSRSCQTANSTPLNIIGQIELEIKIKHIKTFLLVDVATDLITPLILGNDWINPNHVHLYGDQKHLTIPDHLGQSIRISYLEPIQLDSPARLVNQITIPPYSQMLVEVNTEIANANDLIFEPYGRNLSEFILIPHTLLNVSETKAKILVINAQDREQTLPRNTRIGTISRNSTLSIYTTTPKRKQPSNQR